MSLQRWRRRIKYLLLGQALLACAATAAAEAKWVVGADGAFPPFIYKDDSSKLTGLYTEIVEGVLQEAKIEYEIKDFPWKRIVDLTDKNEMTMTIPWRESAERFEKYHLVGPLSASPTVLMVRSDSDIKYETFDDLKGKTIGAVSGYAYPKVFEESKIEKKVLTVNNFQLMQMLIEKRGLDLIIGDRSVLGYETKKNGVGDKVKMLPKVVEPVRRYAGFNKARTAEAKRFGEALEKFKQTKKLDEILAKYGLNRETAGLTDSPPSK